MQDEKFITLLQRACGDDEAEIYEVIQMYEPLLLRHCFVNGIYDKDCEAYIRVNIIAAMRKFNF